jgi:hypothetical protein
MHYLKMLYQLIKNLYNLFNLQNTYENIFEFNYFITPNMYEDTEEKEKFIDDLTTLMTLSSINSMYN